MKLYELCGVDKDIAFSPYCWSIKMALKHKGIDFEAIPCEFTRKDPFENSGSKTVPVLKDGDTWVSDSWHIARYLDDKYPENPLISGPEAEALTRFVSSWTIFTVLVPVFKMLAYDICQLLSEEDQKYFRETRERKFGVTLEEMRDTRPELLEKLHNDLKCLDLPLDTRPFLSGEHPGYADYILFGAFQWARQVSNFNIIPDDGPLEDWFESLLEMYDDYGENAKTV